MLLFVSALSARYHFVLLAIVGSETGRPIQTQTLGGDIVFEGSGGYRLTAQRGTGKDTASSYETTGTYTV
jgi:hypothetical protein